jgi:hypothetical protein
VKRSGGAVPHFNYSRDTLTTGTPSQYGEADMARLLREDPEEFRRRSEAGRLYFHEPRRPGSEVPA